ncbi:glycosyltransferase family protein [Granulosicoccaceae sp. 1_MG-2023]|nr:glycosyltransferase family protein [Granulosicoccaceae sp. 1_MG-2023]
MLRIAFFVSSHGFGHAARACAVMEELIRTEPSLKIDIYSQTPAAFFHGSLSAPVNVFSCATDVGLIQKTPFEADLPASADQIAAFLDFDSETLRSQANFLRKRRTALVISDISPLGIMVAHTAGLKSVLIENFTWDWIYADFTAEYPRFATLAENMALIFSRADLHIKTQPVCDNEGPHDLLVGPLARRPRRDRAEVRADLGVPESHALVMLTQGGIASPTPFTTRLLNLPQVSFIVTGAQETKRVRNLLLLKNDASRYLPDELAACDVIVCKVGYSTLAEAWQAGIPVLAINRPGWRESATLAQFVSTFPGSAMIDEQRYLSGDWLQEQLPVLLKKPRKPAPDADAGLRRTAAAVLQLLEP